MLHILKTHRAPKFWLFRQSVRPKVCFSIVCRGERDANLTRECEGDYRKWDRDYSARSIMSSFPVALFCLLNLSNPQLTKRLEQARNIYNDGSGWTRKRARLIFSPWQTHRRENWLGNPYCHDCVCISNPSGMTPFLLCAVWILSTFFRLVESTEESWTKWTR